VTVDCPVYRAEHTAWVRVACFREAVPDAQAFVEWVTTRDPFPILRLKAGLPDSYVTLTHGLHQQTTYSLARIKEQHIDLQHGCVPTQGLLLHEIAHLCTAEGAAHDHRYVANYLQLVRQWLGQFAVEELLRALRAERAFP